MSDLPIWDKAKEDRTLLSVVLELTARCNNNCGHCYINLPAGDKAAAKKELSFDQITTIIDQSVSLGTLWFLLSGGEPLLRSDFFDIYLYLKKKGMLVSVFTNGSLITKEHIQLFKKYPPRDIEITVYGVTEKVHTRVTGKKTFAATMKGIDMLLTHDLPVTLKSTVMKSNVDEIEQIAQFCKIHSRNPFRFDPFLHFRIDGDQQKNKRIAAERLSADEIVGIEQKDPARREYFQKMCHGASQSQTENPQRIFRCMAGRNSCSINPEGELKLCSSLGNKKSTYDLRKGSLKHGWEEFVPGIMKIESNAPAFLETCGKCNLHDTCSWCPAHAELETGKLDGHLPYFCEVTHSRKESFA